MRGRAGDQIRELGRASPPCSNAAMPAPKKMKAYASFDLYLADQPPKNRAVISALRAFVARVTPNLVESVKWGNGCWVDGKVPVAYVYSAEDHVHFGFVHGSALADPKRLLQGEGAYVRHVKVRKVADIDERALSPLLKQAARETAELHRAATKKKRSLRGS